MSSGSLACRSPESGSSRAARSWARLRAIEYVEHRKCSFRCHAPGRVNAAGALIVASEYRTTRLAGPTDSDFVPRVAERHEDWAAERRGKKVANVIRRLRCVAWSLSNVHRIVPLR